MTNFFVVYDPATGAIRRSGFCAQSADVTLQARAGEAVLATDRFCSAEQFAVDVAQGAPRVVAKG